MTQNNISVKFLAVAVRANRENSYAVRKYTWLQCTFDLHIEHDRTVVAVLLLFANGNVALFFRWREVLVDSHPRYVVSLSCIPLNCNRLRSFELLFTISMSNVVLKWSNSVAMTCLCSTRRVY